MGMNGIFGGFTGGIFNNNLGFSPGLLPGQVVPFNPNFNPTPFLNAFFQPYPWATNSLVLSNQIALTGGGTPLIASYPTVSPFTNQFLNQFFNPAISAGMGGIIPGMPGTPAPAPMPAPAPAPAPAGANTLRMLSLPSSAPASPALGANGALSGLQGLGIGNLGGLGFI